MKIEKGEFKSAKFLNDAGGMQDVRVLLSEKELFYLLSGEIITDKFDIGKNIWVVLKIGRG